MEYPGDALFCPNCGSARTKDQSGDPMVGSTVADRYLLLERIGHGGSGTIYRGEHITLRRRVAVKVLHHELSRDDLAIERFRREATTVGQIDNEHIVEIFDFGRTEDGRLYLAMELLDGETLSELIDREGPQQVSRVVDVLKQVGQALMEAHAMGYVHRDLRPRNVLLARRRGRSEFVKLLDFGLAKLVEREGEAASTSLGMTFGDPHYMSPEQARGDAIDRRADIYSLGCIAYQMLVGEPPFVGGKVFDVLTRHIEQVPVEPAVRRPEIPVWLNSAVMRMLAKRPDDRFITVYRLIEALEQGAGSGAVMSDEVARRAETTPPPSVSQAMAKLGARAASEMEIEPGSSAGAAAGSGAGASASAGAQASASAAEGAAAEARDDAGAALEGGARPVGAVTRAGWGPGAEGDPQPAPEPAATGPSHEGANESGGGAAAAAAAAGKRGSRSGQGPSLASSSGGLSAAWYADGDAMTEDAAALEDALKNKLDQAWGRSPSHTGLMQSDDDDLYVEDPGRRRWWLAGGLVVGIALVAVVAYAVWPGGEGTPAKAAPNDQADQKVLTSQRASMTASAAAAGTAPTGAHPAATAAGTAPATATDAHPAATAAGAPAGQVAAAGAEADPAGKGQGQSAGRAVASNDHGATSQGSHTTGDSHRTSSESSHRSSGESGAGSSSHHASGGSSHRSSSGSHRTSGGSHAGGGDPSGGDDADRGGGGSGSRVSAADAQKANFFAKLGDRDLTNGDVLGAATNFNKARELDRNNATAILGLGEIALNQGSTGAAISHLKHAVKLSPRSSRAQTLLGEAYLAAGKNKSAAASFKRALKIDPDNARARNGYNEAVGSSPGGAQGLRSTAGGDDTTEAADPGQLE